LGCYTDEVVRVLTSIGGGLGNDGKLSHFTIM